jgi:glycosyltransferase involved in cell wall biosynthesis
MVNNNDVELKVGMILPNLYIGGAQEVVRTLAKYLASDRCVPIVCALFDGGPLLDDLVQQGTQVEVLYLSRRPILAFPWYVADMIRIWRTLSQVMINHKINVLQANLLGSQDFLIVALARVMGIPLSFLIFHSEIFLPSWRLRVLIHRLAYHIVRRWASAYIAVSAETKQAMVRLLGLPETDITVICNGVDVEQYRQPVDCNRVRHQLGLNSEARLVITVGTLRMAKGHHYLIEAAVEVNNQYPNTYFLFVGDGELRSELEAQTKAYGLSGRIHFLGNRRDVAELLIASDIFVLPSLWEGLSMALLEAMAAAKPIVATAVSGTSQVMRHNETGILVPPGDAAALAQALVELLSKPAVYACELGEAARRRVEEHFNMKKQATEYLALCDRLMLTNSEVTKGRSSWE